jgi:hypothetical protein
MISTKKLLFVILVVAIALVSVRVYTHYTSQGTIVLDVASAGTEIYLDSQKKAVTQTKNETVSLAVSSGTHVVLASHPQGFPWRKNFSVEGQKTYRGSVFTEYMDLQYALVQPYTSINGNIQPDETYHNTIPLFDSLPQKQTSDDGNVTIEIEGANIRATWSKGESEYPYFFCRNDVCDDSFLVLPASYDVRAIDFYPQKNNRIIFAANDMIWTIELDRNPLQNAQPLYQGTQPVFVVDSQNNLYILDNEELIKMYLQ